MKKIVVKQEGYAYIFISNENPTQVDIHFDDFKVTHTKSNVIQYNEYYPFGLQTASSWTRESTTGNNFLYNAGNELNKDNGWYEMFYRGYDPALGRFMQVDPLASLTNSLSPYQYANCNPVFFNDPWGLKAAPTMAQLREIVDHLMKNGGGTWSRDAWDNSSDPGPCAGCTVFGGNASYSYSGNGSGGTLYVTSSTAQVSSDGSEIRGYATVSIIDIDFNNGTFDYTGLDEKDDDSWFDQHYRNESGFEVSVGAQTSFIVVAGVVVPVPYIKGVTPGVFVNLGSAVVAQGKADTKNGAKITTTLSDKVFNHGAAISGIGMAAEYKVSHGPSGVVDHGVSVNILGVIGLEYNVMTEEVSVGLNFSARGALIGGVEGYTKQGFVFKL